MLIHIIHTFTNNITGAWKFIPLSVRQTQFAKYLAASRASSIVSQIARVRIVNGEFTHSRSHLAFRCRHFTENEIL
jgi:hypothetical protein